MGVYTGNVPGITPNTSNDNCSLDAAASESAQIISIGWGGEAISSTAMRTRVGRSVSGATPVAGNVQKHHPHTPSNLVTFVTGWTTQPTLDAGELLPGIGSWNAHGGLVKWLAGPNEDIWIIGAAQFSIRNALGVAVSSYGITWIEP